MIDVTRHTCMWKEKIYPSIFPLNLKLSVENLEREDALTILQRSIASLV